MSFAYYTEPEKRVPIAFDVDVVVAGAGVAGPMIYPESSYAGIDKHGPGGAQICYAVGGVDGEEHRAFVEEQELLGRSVRLGKSCDGSVLIGREGPERAGHQDGRYGHDAVRISRDEIQVRLDLFEQVQRWKREVPAFEEAYLMFIAPYFGARGGPCVEGEYTVTYVDMKKGVRFPDALYRFTSTGWLRRLRLPEEPEPRAASEDCLWTDFPYRAMVPKEVDGLLAVGRSASGIPDTLLRDRMTVMHMGQAGGLAAALAVQRDTTLRELDVKLLQERLLGEGFFLGDRARLEQLGLC